MIRFKFSFSRKVIGLAAWMVAASLGPVGAQQQTPAPVAPSPQGETAEQKARREQDLKVLEEAISANAEARRRLEAEVESVKADRAKLNAALIETAERVRGTEDRIQGLEQRLQTLGASETAIRRSLQSRRGVIVEVFAALQRMGRRPPPAVLVRPEDMLEAVRASIMLGAVLPELRSEAEVLATDLGELVRLKAAIATDRTTLNGELAGLNREQARLAALMEARQSRIAEVERNVGAERQKAEDLARQAGTLKELIDRMEAEITGAQRAAEEARKAAEAQQRETREKFAQAGLPGSRPPGAQDPLRGGARAAAASRQRRYESGIRRSRRVWRNDAWHFDHDAAESERGITGGWMGRLCGPLPLLWSTLDHQCRWGILYSPGRYGPNQRRCRAVRARGRTRCDHGRGSSHEFDRRRHRKEQSRPLC